jgi:hypothetical protein
MTPRIPLVPSAPTRLASRLATNPHYIQETQWASHHLLKHIATGWGAAS